MLVNTNAASFWEGMSFQLCKKYLLSENIKRIWNIEEHESNINTWIQLKETNYGKI